MNAETGTDHMLPLYEDLTDKLELARKECNKSHIIRDVENQVFTD